MTALSALLTICEGIPPVSGPSQRTIMWIFYDSFIVSLGHDVKQTVKLPVVWNSMTLMWCHCKDLSSLTSSGFADIAGYRNPQPVDALDKLRLVKLNIMHSVAIHLCFQRNLRNNKNITADKLSYYAWKWNCFSYLIHYLQKHLNKWTFVNTLRPRQNLADDIFKHIFFNESIWISMKISLKLVPKGSINKNPALVQIMAWCHTGGKPLSEPIMASFADAYMCHSASMS